jgi:hypothetical protein
MTKSQPQTPLGKVSKPHRRHTKASMGRMRNAWLVVAIITIFLIGLFIQVGWRTFLESLYRPAAVILIVFLAIEYIIIKGRDRSRIYRIELQSLREKRREDIEFIRNLEEDLEQIDEVLAELRMSLPSDSMDQMTHVSRVRDRLDAIRNDLKDLI